MTDCPLCDFQAGFSHELAYHIGSCHDEVKRDDRGDHVSCWCGQGPFSIFRGYHDANSQFGVHLHRNGGAAAHWLACGLGLQQAVKP
jgi:hypothetical protein